MEQEKEQEQKKKERRKTIVEWGIYFVILAAIYIIFHFFLMIGRIPTESMEPLLNVHDWAIGDRNAYDDATPQRGDILMFYLEEEHTTLIKRVIGLPGETVSFVDGHVYIDGEPLDESAYLSEDVVTECEETFTVPEDSYFMMGDNREISLDARYWENHYITLDDVKSKYLFVIPFHKLPWY